jgi:hypothetical protein
MENYIKNITKRIISEEIDNRIFDIENKIFENKNMEKQVCSECGGKMYEGECMECGGMYEGDIQELGGMDDSHPFFGGKNLRDIPKKDIERFFKNREEDEDYKDRSMYDPYYGDDDEEEYYPELRMPRDMPSYKTKYRHSDDEEEITEKLHGKQRKLDKNKNNRIDSEDFKMLRKQQDETEQLYEVEFEKEVGEGETDESKEFAYAAMMAKKKGKKTFELDGETFDVKESYMRKKSKSKVNESILIGG